MLSIESWTADPARLQPMDPDETDVDRLFRHFFSQKNLFSTIPPSIWSPPTDVFETPDTYVVHVEIPGMETKDIDIALNANVLTVRGRRCDRGSETKLNFLQMEIHYGYFEKVITLPHGIDPDVQPAKYKNGFLRIAIRKSSASRAGRRQIEIST